MGMGLLRWLLWPRRPKDDEDDRPSRRSRGRPPPRAHHPGVYRIEVDNEVGRFHGDGTPFSFWSSSRVILILSFLLWWIQPAGPMIAGYVGGRRAGSPIKAVIAALMPVFAIYIANITYAHNFASHQIDFVATLPMVVSDAAASILPFLLPYKEFMVAYMQGFAQALTTTFGMGTNGYLMVVIFAYIGGLIAEQTRRELGSRSGSGSSVGVNLVQPVIGARPYVDDEEQAYEEDEEIHRSRRPVRARTGGTQGRRGRGTRGGPAATCPRPQPGRGTRDPAVRRACATELRSREALTFPHNLFIARSFRLLKGFMFCPKCSSLMFPVQGKLHCNSCGYERSFSGKDATTAKVARSGKEKPSETLVLDEITETLPKTRVECPKCGHYEAFWVMRQTRAADEPTTRIYRCVKDRKSTRLNSSHRC